MKKDFLQGPEQLEHKRLLSSNPWYIDAIRASATYQNIEISNNKPVVAIVDSGADLNHELLKNNLWRNPKDPVDGIDNDSNGYVDDNVGWDFVQNDGVPQGDFYHGTHVAGIVKLITNGNVDLMILRFQDNNGLGYAGAAAYAINYAVQMKKAGVNLVAINCSFGGLSYNSSVIDNAIKNASNNNILVVIATGNENVNTDLSPRYPGSLKYANTITVAAIDQSLALAGYSNYGKSTIEVASPGSNIYSSLPNNNYGYVSGTSMAAPMVSAAAGLLKTLGNYSAGQIRDAIIRGSEMVSGLLDKVSYGLINVLNAWNILKSQSPLSSGGSVVASPTIVSKPVSELLYGFYRVDKRIIEGWVKVTNSPSKPIVYVYINKYLRYVVVANNYRVDRKSYDAYKININKKFMNLKNNLVEIKIKSSLQSPVVTIYKKYIY